MLYSKNGAQPVELPFWDTDPSGDEWTNLPNNERGRNACGWVAAPQPTFDPKTQYLDWAGGAWRIRPLDVDAAALQDLQTQLLADLATIRWTRQQTVLFNGQELPADDVTIGRCTAAEAYARNKGLDFETPRNWKIADGVWTTLTTTQIIAYGIAIGDHMQACFDQEKLLSDQIMASPTAQAARMIDLNAGWPA